MNTILKGHLLATFTVIVWGLTFISTKILLIDFLPIEILFTRFLLGAIVMYIFYPKLLGFVGWQKELTFALAGFFGVTLYFLLENIALTYSLATNVGVIITISPFFTAIINHFFIKDEKLYLHFFVGFLISLVGIFLLSKNTDPISFNPFGDFLAILAALSWSCYSIFIKKACSYGYKTLEVTRCTFVYGLIFMIPAMFFMGFELKLERFLQIENSLNILFLGLCASALCFFTWNIAVKSLGVVKSSAYIYAIPTVTVITAILILDEKLTLWSFIGILMTLLGLFISESYLKFKLILKKLS